MLIFADIRIDPSKPGSGQVVSVSATITATAEADLVYEVGFGEEQRVAMVADGGRFSADVPGQAAGSLVRYRIEAPQGLSHPKESDSRGYEGYVVKSPGLDTDLARLQWFIDESDFEEMLGTSRFDRDRLFPAVVVFNGTVF